MSGARSCNRGVFMQNATTYSASSRNYWRNRTFHLGNVLFLANSSFPTFFLCLVNKKKNQTSAARKRRKNRYFGPLLCMPFRSVIYSGYAHFSWHLFCPLSVFQLNPNLGLYLRLFVGLSDSQRKWNRCLRLGARTACTWADIRGTRWR